MHNNWQFDFNAKEPKYCADEHYLTADIRYCYVFCFSRGQCDVFLSFTLPSYQEVEQIDAIAADTSTCLFISREVAVAEGFQFPDSFESITSSIHQDLLFCIQNILHSSKKSTKMLLGSPIIGFRIHGHCWKYLALKI